MSETRARRATRRAEKVARWISTQIQRRNVEQIARDTLRFEELFARTEYQDRPATYWNGVRVLAVRGTAIVAENDSFDEYKSRHLIGRRIKVVMVFLDGAGFGGGVDYLDDRYGEAWMKLTEGRGSPRYTARHLMIEEGSFTSSEGLEHS